MNKKNSGVRTFDISEVLQVPLEAANQESEQSRRLSNRVSHKTLHKRENPLVILLTLILCTLATAGFILGLYYVATLGN